MNSEDLNFYDKNKSDEEMKGIMKTLTEVKYGRSVIAAQIEADIKRRACYEADLPEGAIIWCKYLAPLPNEKEKDAFVFGGDPTKIKFDIEKVTKVFESAISDIKKYYPEMKAIISFVEEDK